MPTAGACVRCGYMASNELCKACLLLDGLNKGTAKYVHIPLPFQFGWPLIPYYELIILFSFLLAPLQAGCGKNKGDQAKTSARGTRGVKDGSGRGPPLKETVS